MSATADVAERRSHAGSCPGTAGTCRRPGRVVVINDLSVKRGGATGMALANAEALAERSVPVTFISGDGASRSLDVEHVPLGSTHILEGRRLSAAMRGVYDRRVGHLLATWIAQSDQPDVVYHLHGWSKILSPSVFTALAPVMPRTVLHLHDFFVACPNGGYYDFKAGKACDRRALGPSCLATNCDRRSYAHKLWRVARQAAVSRALDPSRVGHAIVVHEGMIPLLAASGFVPPRISAVRNPAQAWQQQRVTAEENRTFLFVGRLDHDKGVDIAVRAADAAGVPLRVIGDGELRSALERDYPAVEFTGWRSQGEIAELCADARALVVATRWRETFGLVALEAAMSGLPLIASRNMLLSQELADCGFGVTFAPESGHTLVTALQEFARDDDLVAGMSRRAFAGGHRLTHTSESWTDALLAIYAQLLGD